MKFLTDQDVYFHTVKFLRTRGYDVRTAAEFDVSAVPDRELLEQAIRSERILVTRDRDFGKLVFTENISCGVIYLRFTPFTLTACHKEFERVLDEYSEDILSSVFIVVEPGRHRIRKLR